MAVGWLVYTAVYVWIVEGSKSVEQVSIGRQGAVSPLNICNTRDGVVVLKVALDSSGRLLSHLVRLQEVSERR